MGPTIEGLHEKQPPFETGDDRSATELVARVKIAVRDWLFDRISIGYPGPLQEGIPSGDPPRIGSGWVGFDYETALGKPVRFINHASLQALGAYRGGRMLFLGLGTGLGSTLITDNVLIPLELGWLRFDARSSLLQRLADGSPQRRKLVARLGSYTDSMVALRHRDGEPLALQAVF